MIIRIYPQGEATHCKGLNGIIKAKKMTQKASF